MKNPVVNLQKTPASKISSSVRMRNSGFSFNCRGQSTLSINCRYDFNHKNRLRLQKYFSIGFYLSTLSFFTRNERHVI